jgi:hypothetical protein
MALTQDTRSFPEGVACADSFKERIWLSRSCAPEEETQMLTLRKGNISISVDVWLRAQHPASEVTAEKYIALYRAALERDGWHVVREQ